MCADCISRRWRKGTEFSHPFTRTVTEMDNVLFTSLTMNVAPIHLDEEYAKATCPRAGGW